MYVVVGAWAKRVFNNNNGRTLLCMYISFLYIVCSTSLPNNVYLNILLHTIIYLVEYVTFAALGIIKSLLVKNMRTSKLTLNKIKKVSIWTLLLHILQKYCLDLIDMISILFLKFDKCTIRRRVPKSPLGTVNKPIDDGVLVASYFAMLQGRIFVVIKKNWSSFRFNHFYGIILLCYMFCI